MTRDRDDEDFDNKNDDEEDEEETKLFTGRVPNVKVNVAVIKVTIQIIVQNLSTFVVEWEKNRDRDCDWSVVKVKFLRNHTILFSELWFVGFVFFSPLPLFYS